jgi:lysophospholipase
VRIEDSGGVVHWFEQGGVRLRAAHWPQGERGTVLLLSGRTDYVERFFEPVSEWQSRGYAVWMLDWRGQGASQRLLPDPIRNHVRSFADYLADGETVLDHAIRQTPKGGKFLLMGHSMGGHLGAHLLARRPGLFAGAILSAPMIDFVRGSPMPRSLALLLAHLMCLRPGMAHRFGPGTSARTPVDRPFLDNPLTSCPDRYAAQIALMQAQPDLLVAGATWGWLRAALASTIALNRAATIRRITMPVLVALAGADRLVDNAAIRRFAQLLPRGQLLELPGARHEMLNERDEYRLPLWAAIDEFVGTIG